MPRNQLKNDLTGQIRRKKIQIVILLVLIALVLTALILSLIFLPRLFNSGNSTDNGNNTGKAANTSIPDQYAAYPNLELQINKSLAAVKTEYPGGSGYDSKGTDGRMYHSYQVENADYLLLFQSINDAPVSLASLMLKNLQGCVLNETILDHIAEVVPYAHFDPKAIGSATNYIGIPTGLASFYDYKPGMVLSVTCTTVPAGVLYYDIMYFKNP